MEVSYQSASVSKTIISDKVQFAVAALLLVVGYVDTFNSYNNWMIILPIIGFLLAACNGAVIIWYNSIKEKFGRYFEIQMFRVNGAVLMLTALGYHFEGKHTIQYVYYLLAIIYFLLLPRLVLKFRTRMNLEIDEEGITDNKSIRTPSFYKWDDINKIIINSEVLELVPKDSKIKKFYFTEIDSNELDELILFLKEKSSNKKLELLVNV